MKVYVASARGFEGEMEAIAAFSTYLKAYAFVRKQGYKSWAIEELTIDEDI